MELIILGLAIIGYLSYSLHKKNEKIETLEYREKRLKIQRDDCTHFLNQEQKIELGTMLNKRESRVTDFLEQFDDDPHGIGIDSIRRRLDYLRAVAKKQRAPIGPHEGFWAERNMIFSSNDDNYKPDSLDDISDKEIIGEYFSQDIDFDHKMNKFH